MRNFFTLALGACVVSQAHAVILVDGGGSLGTLTASETTAVPGTLVSRVGAQGSTADDTWTDQFSFTMSSEGSFVAKIDSFYNPTDRQSTLISFTGLSVFSQGGGSAVASLSPSIGAFDFTHTFDPNLAAGNYVLSISGRTSGTGVQAGYKLSAHADYTAAVPEPSTYALLALGLGAVGLMRRNRMRRED